MKRTIASCLLILGLNLSPAWGQGGNEMEALQQQLQALQDQLAKMNGTSSNGGRVTQIGSSASRGRDPVMSVRLYDVSDLFAMAPSYDATYGDSLGKEQPLMLPQMTGGAGGAKGGFGGGGFFNVKPGTVTKPMGQHALMQISGGNLGGAQASVNDLIKAIQQTIAPNSWDTVGGTATIATLGNALMISAEDSSHQQIESLLNLFRKKWGTLRTISVRAYWLWLGDKELETLLQRKLPAGELPTFGVVDDAVWQKHMEQLVEAGEKRRLGYRSVITCYNGQTVSTRSGTEHLAVTDIRPMLARDSEMQVEGNVLPKAMVAYRPTLQVLHEGAALQVTPLSNSSGKYVVLDIHSRVARLDAPPRAPAPKADAAKPDAAVTNSPSSVAAALDRPVMRSHRLSTTMRVPVDRYVLVGGMTFEGVTNPGEADL